MPDARVQAAIDNWAPRMVTQGVDYNDFVRTTARIERWEEWLDAWSETAELHLGLAREAEAAERDRTAGEAYVRAALCFHFAKYVWVVDGDRNRTTTERARDALYDAHRLLDPTAERIEAPLDGATVYANLRRPPEPERPPLVILIPGLDSTKEEFFNFERVFLDRGMATLSLDGPGQGEGGFEAPIRPDYEVAVGRGPRRARGAQRPRPRPGRRRRGQPRRLLRAARRRVRASPEGGRRRLGAGQLRRALGRPADADPGVVRALLALAGPRDRPRAGARARPRRGRAADLAAAAGGHRQARPADSVGVDQGRRRRGAERRRSSSTRRATTSATTSPIGTARCSPTGSASSSPDGRRGPQSRGGQVGISPRPEGKRTAFERTNSCSVSAAFSRPKPLALDAAERRPEEGAAHVVVDEHHPRLQALREARRRAPRRGVKIAAVRP